jgi:hypothetical protein
MVTAIWLLAMVTLFLTSAKDAVPIKLNEWGDFFAGFFAPVAFLWLVLGYLQQGHELQLSTKALELQAEELRNSVDQQRQLVEVTRKQVDAELEALREERQLRVDAAKPKFVFPGTGAMYTGGEARYTCSVQNVGSTVTEVSFVFEPAMKYTTLTRMPSFARNVLAPFEFVYTTSQAEEISVLTVRYEDSNGQAGASKFRLLPIPGNTHNMVEFVPGEA